MSSLTIYAPNIYSDIVEMQALLGAEDEEFNILADEMETFKNNQYITTADVDGIVLFENQLGIIADPSIETLEFRKARLINRLSTSTPFTYFFLVERLNNIIGENLYILSINYSDYELVIESSAEDQTWFHEIRVTINSIKPANMVFINRPLVTDTIYANEQINLTDIQYNYKLGSWELGLKSFYSSDDKGVIKVAGVSSVQSALLNDLAVCTINDIDNVLINGVYEVSTFETKTAVGGVATIEYYVDAITSGISEITTIAIRKADNSILTSASVYIPLEESVLLKHLITVMEGA